MKIREIELKFDISNLYASSTLIWVKYQLLGFKAKTGSDLMLATRGNNIVILIILKIHNLQIFKPGPASSTKY